MPKKKIPSPKTKLGFNPLKKSEIKNSKLDEIKNTGVLTNGLTDAILGFNPGISGTQVSQVDTVFVNLRWYLISNMRQPLSQAYVELGIVKTVVDVPVDDAFRGGIEIKSKELDPEEIEKIQYTMDQHDDIGVMSQEQKWDRLYGGGGILILTGQNWEDPLDLDSIQRGDPLEFRAVDLWELFSDKQNMQGDGEPIDNPQIEHYRYYSKKVHRSRVLITRGIISPSFIRPRLRGWGISVVEILIRSINQYLKANDLTFEVLDEFKIDIYKIKNLTQTLLSADGTQAIQKRVALANQQKNFQNAITMDGEDDYLQKELAFTGLAETMTGIRMQVASDLRMPLTKVFGISASGFSSGEDDIENYNAMVEATVRSKCKHHLITMVKLRCKTELGYIPDDIQVAFKPLRILSSEQEENVKTQKFNRLLAAKTAGELSSLEFRDACNKDNLLGIQLDTTEESLEMPEPEVPDEKEAIEADTQGAPQSHLAVKKTPEAKV